MSMISMMNLGGVHHPLHGAWLWPTDWLSFIIIIIIIITNNNNTTTTSLDIYHSNFEHEFSYLFYGFGLQTLELWTRVFISFLWIWGQKTQILSASFHIFSMDMGPQNSNFERVFISFLLIWVPKTRILNTSFHIFSMDQELCRSKFPYNRANFGGSPRTN